jgi:hypothetical protein
MSGLEDLKGIREAGEKREDNRNPKLILDPSIFLNRNSLREAVGLIESSEVCVSAAFRHAFEGGSPSPVLWAFYGEEPYSEPGEVRELLDGVWPFQANDASELDDSFRSALLACAGNQVIGSILCDEWAFLTTHSWIGSRTRRTFEKFHEAGAVIIDWSKREFDDAARKTLESFKIEVPRDLSTSHRCRAAAKWLAVGGPTVMGLIALEHRDKVELAGKVFMLFDP